jgi:ribosomal-protein-alanine N-acetyltransferase
MTVDDLDAVVTIETSAAMVPWSERAFVQELGHPSRRWCVALDGSSDVIGFGGLMLVVGEAHVMNIAVDPRHQRQGVGRALLRWLLTAARDSGATAATLEVRADNAAAIALYRNFGFTEAGRRDRYYEDGADAVIMWTSSLSGVIPGPAGRDSDTVPTEGDEPAPMDSCEVTP